MADGTSKNAVTAVQVAPRRNKVQEFLADVNALLPRVSLPRIKQLEPVYKFFDDIISDRRVPRKKRPQYKPAAFYKSLYISDIDKALLWKKARALEKQEARDAAKVKPVVPPRHIQKLFQFRGDLDVPVDDRQLMLAARGQLSLVKKPPAKGGRGWRGRGAAASDSKGAAGKEEKKGWFGGWGRRRAAEDLTSSGSLAVGRLTLEREGER
eukprot:jgi/Mesen1/10565/ME000843S10065